MMSPNADPGGHHPQRLAYADPPYPGLAKKLYGNHPDYAGEVDHAELIKSLESRYDGWALSTSTRALAPVLALCPPQARVAVWFRPNAVRHSHQGDWDAWEPVIVRRAAKADPMPVKNVLMCDGLNSTDRTRTLVGQKPAAFCRWVLAMLGFRNGDIVDDLFPGTGIMGRIAAEQVLPLAWGIGAPGRDRRTLKQLAGKLTDPLPGLSPNAKGAP